MTSRDVTHYYGDKTHEMNKQFALVQSPTISIKQQPSQVYLNLDDQQRMPIMFNRELNKNIDTQLNNAETHSHQHAAANVSLGGSKDAGDSLQHSASFKLPFHQATHQESGNARNNMFSHAQKDGQIQQ